jgi:uncharacterized protein YbjT (DUF2867 family)
MIVITTPTGDIGHQVVENVLAADEPVRVIARDSSRLAASIRARVDVVEGSHGDAEVVNRAFEGADSVFWLVPPDFRSSSVAARYVEFTQPACEAFKSHGVDRVVAVSALGRGSGLEASAGLVTASLAMDDQIRDTGVSYRALTMPSFMDNMLRQVEAIKNAGMFFSPVSADLKAPTCATRDIASVAARLLLDHSWSGQESAPLLGPEDLSNREMAQIISQVLERPVGFQQVPIEAFRTQMLERGASAAMTNGMVEMMVAKDRGLDNAEPRTPESTTPTSFRQWCMEVLKPAVLA